MLIMLICNQYMLLHLFIKVIVLVKGRMGQLLAGISAAIYIASIDDSSKLRHVAKSQLVKHVNPLSYLNSQPLNRW